MVKEYSKIRLRWKIRVLLVELYIRKHAENKILFLEVLQEVAN